MVEPDGQQPLAGHVLDTAMAAAGAQVLVQVADRLGQPGMMGGQDDASGGWVAEAVEDRDALGRPQDHVEGRDGVAAMGRPSSSPVVGWRPSNMAWNPATDASPCSPSEVAPAPYQRPGDSPWPDRYASWSVASSRV